jgi:DNA-binding NarL/FixJ family response regulator
VAAASSSRRLTVCIFSQHSFVLNEFQRLLSGSAIRLQPQHIDSPILSEKPSIPRANVYVVDGEGPPPVTDAMIARIRDVYPQAILLVVAENFPEGRSFSLLQAGAKGLVRYAELSPQLPQALQAVASGGYWVPRDLLSRFVDSILTKLSPRLSIPTRLSRREREITDALLGNLSNKEIARKLNISERTAKFHVSNVLVKFGVRRRTDLILLCVQHATGGSKEPETESKLPNSGIVN